MMLREMWQWLMMQPSEMMAWSMEAPLILEAGRKRGRV